MISMAVASWQINLWVSYISDSRSYVARRMVLCYTTHRPRASPPRYLAPLPCGFVGLGYSTFTVKVLTLHAPGGQAYICRHISCSATDISSLSFENFDQLWEWTRLLFGLCWTRPFRMLKATWRAAINNDKRPKYCSLNGAKTRNTKTSIGCDGHSFYAYYEACNFV